MSDQVIKDPNFAKAVDAGATLSDKYGRWLGALLYVFTLRSAKPPQSVWKSLIWTAGTIAVALITTKTDLLTWMKWLVP